VGLDEIEVFSEYGESVHVFFSNKVLSELDFPLLISGEDLSF